MSNEIPYFEYQPPARYNNKCGAIKLHGEVIYEIEKIEEFYSAVGYTPEVAKKEIWPDEFIWEKYFKDTDKNCPCCFQQHLVGYLLRHSEIFSKKYRYQCKKWLATYASARAACSTMGCIELNK